MAVTYADVLAKNVRAARARKGLEQEPLAARMRALGYSAWRRQTVANVEKGNRRLTAEEVLGLAMALETSTGALMDPVRDDKFVLLPSGQAVGVPTVQRSIRHFNDGMVWWDGNAPLFESQMPSPSGDEEHADMSSLTEFTPEMMRRRNARLDPERPIPDPPPPPPRRKSGGDAQ